jgi:hypothetical protein
MKLKYKVLIGLITVFALSAYADDVAKVVLLKGQVKAKLKDGSVLDVKADQSLPEGAVLQTAEKSFVKLIFIDKSQMNLGPNSQMIINAFPKKEAGIITLVKGQIRSQVTKDYMEMDDKSKSKLYIKTKTAAMGIRGTDFQVNFNPENQNTSLITFEGKVAMAHIDHDAREEKFDQSKLEKVVSSDKAVMVAHGQISAVNLNVAERAMAPTALGTKQLDALKENETGTKESTDGDKKQFRNPLPPGADSAIFSNTTTEKVAATSDSSPKADPNGFFNNKTGEYKLPAGSVIDLNTVNIIPPPANAVFDPNTKTYVVPETFGKIDKTTGEYKAPEGLKLGNDGKFILVDANAYAKSQAVNKEEKKDEKKEGDKKDDKKDGDKKDDKKDGDKKDDKKEADKVVSAADGGKRAPASVDAPPAGAPGPMPAIPQPLANRPEMILFVNTFSPTAPPPPQLPKIDVRAVIDSSTQKREDATNLGTPATTTKAHVIFNPN